MCFAQSVKKRKTKNLYNQLYDVDREDVEAKTIVLGYWRTNTTRLENLYRLGSNHPSISAVQKRRETLKNYFNNEGAVPWQTKVIQ